jgi:RNA polymerase sigma factor (TIGR02999 family)
MVPQDDEITKLIALWQSGDKNSENILFEALYRRLHRIAMDCLRNEPPGKAASPTSLIHSAYLRMMRADRLQIYDRGHFLHLAAKVMRQIVVDKARKRRAQKREGEMASADEVDSLVKTDADADEIISVDRGLDELAKQSGRMAQLVELRHFAGYTFDEASVVMNVSARQLRRDWPVAITRLKIAIDGSHAAGTA